MDPLINLIKPPESTFENAEPDLYLYNYVKEVIQDCKPDIDSERMDFIAKTIATQALPLLNYASTLNGAQENAIEGKKLSADKLSPEDDAKLRIVLDVVLSEFYSAKARILPSETYEKKDSGSREFV